MNEMDRDRLKNLKLSLSAHISEISDAYEKENYLFMSDAASAIEKIAYTINYLESDCRMRDRSKDLSCSIHGESSMTCIEEGKP